VTAQHAGTLPIARAFSDPNAGPQGGPGGSGIAEDKPRPAESVSSRDLGLGIALSLCSRESALR
jgi:hypothetical protein